ncbi:MAG: hypothetical protein IIZ13_14085 [Renibacterium sp.]|nr:hypothetical protein [Renibacterium sp.]
MKKVNVPGILFGTLALAAFSLGLAPASQAVGSDPAGSTPAGIGQPCVPSEVQPQAGTLADDAERPGGTVSPACGGSWDPGGNGPSTWPIGGYNCTVFYACP